MYLPLIAADGNVKMHGSSSTVNTTLLVRISIPRECQFESFSNLPAWQRSWFGDVVMKPCMVLSCNENCEENDEAV